MKGLTLAAMTFGLLGLLLGAHSGSAQTQPVASIELPAPRGTVQLYPGCNNVALSFPDGTTSETVVQAVTPVEAVESMWRHSAALGRFEGFDPAFPDVSDLRMVDLWDAVWLCLAAPPPGQETTLTSTTLECLGPEGTVSPNPLPTIQVTLRDEAGAPLAGREISWSDGPEIGMMVPSSSETDGTGVATADYVFPWDMGEEWDEVVTATFAGDATYASSSCQVTIHAMSPGLPTPPS